MSETIQDNMYVELLYRVIDCKTGSVLAGVDFPIGYVHGANDILAPAVMDELKNKAVGDVIKVGFDGSQIFGPRDESLVFTDRLENVPEEYREIGATILAENQNGETRRFIVTRMDDKSLTVDGNNPLCGRQVEFKLEIVGVRPATAEEIVAGGPAGRDPDVGPLSMFPF